MRHKVNLMVKLTIALIILGFIGLPGLSHANWDNFKTVLYTGNGETQSITGVGFKPDLVWIKCRTTARSHQIYDSIRGPNRTIYSNLVNAEEAAVDRLMSFDSDGFTLGGEYNTNDSYVAWCWKAGDSAVSNTDGSITSTVSANPDAGFSIVKYPGNGIAGATVGHGLNAVPKFIIIKRLNFTTGNWPVYHASNTPEYTQYLDLTNKANPSSRHWNDTSPSEDVFTIGDYGAMNSSGYEYIAYVWTEIPEVNSFGSYTGNGRLQDL